MLRWFLASNQLDAPIVYPKPELQIEAEGKSGAAVVVTDAACCRLLILSFMQRTSRLICV